MDNESGRGSRSHEPPKLANVRRLHLDEAAGSSATATEDWYETERLTGHITGGARTTPPTDPPTPPQDERPVVLDWRHTEASLPPTVLERLGRSLDARRYRRRRKPTADSRETDGPARARARGARTAALAAPRQAAPPAAAQDQELAADQIRSAQPSGPRIGLRGDTDPAPRHPRRRPGHRTSARDRKHRPRLWNGSVVSAGVLSVVAVAVVGIASQASRTAARPRHASVNAATSTPGAALNTTANTVIGALATLEPHVRKGHVAHRASQTHRRSRRNTRHPGRPGRSHRAVSSSTPVATSASGSSASSGSPTGTSSYSSSSSSPAYSSQPAASESAPAPTKSAPPPPGPSGLGGAVGNNCNPKCS
jgi:hypothetical protein